MEKGVDPVLFLNQTSSNLLNIHKGPLVGSEEDHNKFYYKFVLNWATFLLNKNNVTFHLSGSKLFLEDFAEGVDYLDFLPNESFDTFINTTS